MSCRLAFASICGCLALFQASGTAHTASLPAYVGDGQVNVGILIMPGLFISEATIPFDVFKHVAGAKMNTYFVAETMDPITTYYGTRLAPHYTFATAPTADVFVMPSGIGSHDSFLLSWYSGSVAADTTVSGKTTNGVAVKYYGNNTALIEYTKAAAASAQFVTSHCWGAFTLADAGLLDAQTVTTFPGYTATLKTHYPAIAAVVDDQRFVVSGNVVTSNGGLAAFEACLYVIRHIYGDETATAVIGGLVYSPENIGHSKLEYYKASPAKEGEKIEQVAVVNVGIWLPEGLFIAEPVGPFDVFAHMGAHMNVFFVGENMDPKTTYYGATMYPDYDITNHPAIDVLVVPSGIGSHWSFLTAWYGGAKDAVTGVITGATTNGVPVTYYGNSTAMMGWLRATSATAKYTTSHCWGAFSLADAGILDGLTATTFPGYQDDLHMYYPAIKEVIKDNRIVQDGKVITSNGGVAAYEAANYVVKLLFGEYYAKQVALGLVYAHDNYNYVNTPHMATHTSITCMDAKNAYKKNMCCGNPNAEFDENDLYPAPAADCVGYGMNMITLDASQTEGMKVPTEECYYPVTLQVLLDAGEEHYTYIGQTHTNEHAPDGAFVYKMADGSLRYKKVEIVATCDGASLCFSCDHTMGRMATFAEATLLSKAMTCSSDVISADALKGTYSHYAWVQMPGQGCGSFVYQRPGDMPLVHKTCG